MFAFWFQASSFRECGAESFWLLASRDSESRELQKAESGIEETGEEVRVWRRADIKHGKRKIS